MLYRFTATEHSIECVNTMTQNSTSAQNIEYCLDFYFKRKTILNNL